MSINLPSFTKDMNIIQTLDDQPALTPSQLKSKFDEGGKSLKEYINDTLLPAIQTDVGNEINSQTGNLETTLTEYIDTEVNNLKTNDIDPISNSVSTLQGQVNGLQTSVNSLQNSDTGLQNQINQRTKWSDFSISTESVYRQFGVGEQRSENISIYKAGYYPIAIAGFSSSDDSINIGTLRLTSSANSSGVISLTLHNQDYGNIRASWIGFDILWVRIL